MSFDWLNSPRRRATCGVLVIVIVVVAMRLAQGTEFYGWIGGLFFSSLSVSILLVFLKRWKRLKPQRMRYEMSVVRVWRKFFHLSPFMKALHVLAIAISLAGIAVGFLTDWNDYKLFWIAGSLLVVTGVCEVAAQANRLLKKAWAPVLGKVLSISVGAVIAAISHSQAKQLMHSLSPIDTKYMSEFVAMLAIVFFFTLTVAVVGICVAVYGFLNLIFIMGVTMVDSWTIQARPVLGINAVENRRMYWYRIREGKRPPGRVLPLELMSEFEISMWMSTLSKFLIAAVLVQAYDSSDKVIPSMRPWLMSIMVGMEYRTGSHCKGIDKETGVVYMDDGNVSVARKEAGGYVFKVETCQYEGQTSK